MTQRFTSCCLFLVLAIIGSGCATIVKDATQPITFNSEPPGAKVAVNGVDKGHTPLTFNLERSASEKHITMTLDGYHPIRFKLEKTVAPMVLGNIIFGGVIGLAVDSASGRANNYESEVKVTLVSLDKPAPPEAISLQTAEDKANYRSINAPMGEFSAIVTQLDRKRGKLSLNMGADDGLRRGLRLTISTNDSTVCEVEIIDTLANKCTGRIVSGDPFRQINANQEVVLSIVAK